MRAILVALAVILFVTLAPISGPAETVSVLCLVCGPYGTADFVLNVVLFMPLGFLAARRFPDARRILVLVLLLTAGIELAQLLIPGRHTTAGDIVANCLGGALGIWASRGGLVRTFGQVYPYGLVAMILGTVWAYEPYIQDSVLVGQWTPALEQFDTYRGRIVGAFSGSLALPDGTLAAAVHDSVRAAPDGVPITVQFIAGPQTRRIAPILRVIDEQEREALLVAAQGTDLVLRMRSVAGRLRLHSPQVRLTGAHPEEGSNTIVRFERRGREFCIGTPVTASCQSSVTPARGWFLLTGWSLPGGGSSAADVLWLGGLAVLLLLGPGGARRWLPALAYVVLWIILPGDPAWLPGLLGLLTASVGITVFDRTPPSASPTK